MGLDLEIYLKIEGPVSEELEHAASKLGELVELKADERSEIAELYDRSDIDATHFVNSFHRYWSQDYRHGPVGEILVFVIAALRAPEVDRIWYGNDSGYTQVVTPEWLVDFVLSAASR